MPTSYSSFLHFLRPSLIYLEKQRNIASDTTINPPAIEEYENKRWFNGYVTDYLKCTHIYANLSLVEEMKTTNRAGKDDWEHYYYSFVLSYPNSKKFMSISAYKLNHIKFDSLLVSMINNMITYKSRYNTISKDVERCKFLTLSDLFKKDYKISDLQKIITKNMGLIGLSVCQAHINVQLNEYFNTKRRENIVNSQKELVKKEIDLNGYSYDVNDKIQTPLLLEAVVNFKLAPFFSERNINVYQVEVYTIYIYQEAEQYKLLYMTNLGLPIMYEYNMNHLESLINLIKEEEINKRTLNYKTFNDFYSWDKGKYLPSVENTNFR